MDLGFRDVFQDFPLNQSIDGDERVISGFQRCGESKKDFMGYIWSAVKFPSNLWPQQMGASDHK